MPVSLVKVEADEVFAVEIFLTYDSTLIFEGLRYEDAQQNPTLLNSWYVDTAGDLENLEDYLDKNFISDGSVDTLKIAGATISHPLSNGGVLFYVDFTIPDDRDSRVIPVELAYVVLNADIPAVVPVDGSITLAGPDGLITPPTSLARELEVQGIIADVDGDRGLPGPGSARRARGRGRPAARVARGRYARRPARLSRHRRAARAAAQGETTSPDGTCQYTTGTCWRRIPYVRRL